MDWNYGSYGFLNYDMIAEKTLCINDLGLEFRHNEVYDYDNNKRNYSGYLFQYTLEGDGIYETQNENFLLAKGTAFFITFPEDSRYYLPQNKASGQYWAFFYLHFSGPAAHAFFRRIRDLKGPVFSLDLNSPPILQFLTLYESLIAGNQLERYKGSEWLYSFLITLLRHLENPADQIRNSYVNTAKNWMRNHFMKEINLETMCAELGVSFSHLSRQFHKESGITPIGYLTHIRLEHAMQLLLNTDLSILCISQECGFSNSNYFTKVFKKKLRITPSAYRNQHK